MRRSGGAFVVIIIAVFIVVWLAVNQFHFIPKVSVTDPETGQTTEENAVDHAKENVEKLNGAQEDYVNMYDNMYEEDDDSQSLLP